MKTLIKKYVVVLMVCLTNSSIAVSEEINVPLEKAKTGNLYVNGIINNQIKSSFLVDTGAGMVTISRDLLTQIKRASKVTKSGEMAARLANGKLAKMDLYKVESFAIGDNCNLGEMEVAVITGGGRNILGLNALTVAAPFSVHINPLKLVLSGCPSINEIALM